MKNCINIVMGTKEITIKILDNATHKEVLESLNKRITELKKLYKNEKTPILVAGKVLKNKEMQEIKQIIQEKIDVEVDFETPKELGLSGIKRTYNQEIKVSETKYHKGSLRSGQRVEFEGSIVIIGDVNAGAEVIAGGNIAIVGVLRGLAHAGAKGNKEAIIATVSMESPQVRIANIIKKLEQEDKGKKYAYAFCEQIVITE